MSVSLVVVSPKPENFHFLNSLDLSLRRESEYCVSAETDRDSAEAAIDLARKHHCDAAFFTHRPKLTDFCVLMMDMDCTTIENETLDEMAGLAGLGPSVQRVTQQAMLGLLNFQDSLQMRLKLFAGQSVSLFDRVINERLRARPGIRQWLSTCHQAGLSAHLISGGFTQTAEYCARTFGFDDARANVAEIHQNRFTGRLLGEIVDADLKAQYCRRYAKEARCPLNKVIAIGDGANDIPMLKTAGLAIGMRPKPATARYCDICLYVTDYRHLPLFFAT